MFLAELNATRLTPYWHALGLPWGVSHLSDIAYFFNAELPWIGDNGKDAMAMSKQYAGSFASFANSGDPVGEAAGGTFAKWPPAYAEAEENDKFAVLIIGGPYGTSPAITGPTEEETDNEKLELKKRGRRPGEWVLEMEEGDAAMALGQEKLVERCDYINSLLM